MSFEPPLSCAFDRRFADAVAAESAGVPPVERPGIRGSAGPGRAGAVGRGLAVAVLVMLPALLIPELPPETAHLVVLLALAAAALTVWEYTAPGPGLIEFRVAAPYNRARCLMVGLGAVLLALLQRQGVEPGAPGGWVAALAAACGEVLGAAPGPVALLVMALPESVGAAERALVRDGAALVLSLGAATVALFAAVLRAGLWPRGGGSFNLWVNLPSFEPTAGRDVVARLRRQSRLSLGGGLALPFLLPGVVLGSTLFVQPVSLTAPLGYVWGLVLWAYLPVALILRGMALGRVARLIEARRARRGPGSSGSGDPAG